MIYTFYSYKGGVGRTMALANVAELFYQTGLKVLMVDWDVEAPGLERYFFSPKDLQEILDKPGLMDIILRYKAQMARELEDDAPLEFENPAQYIVDIYPNQSGPGKLFLLTAGQRSKPHFAAYAEAVLTFDWKEFYEKWDGELYFEWLRERFENIADVILIDSRTGVTEMGGVCTYQMANTIVMFCAPNRQNLEGTSDMASNFMSPRVQELRSDRPLNLLIVPARIDDDESDFLNEFQREFLQEFTSYAPKQFGIDVNQLWQLKIPYVPRYAYKEIVAVQERTEAIAEKMIGAFNQLTFAISRLAPENSPIRSALPETKIQIGGDIITGSKIGKDIVITGDQNIVNIYRSFPLNVPLQRPPRVTHFTDRESELAQILSEMHPGKVMTICGPGGIGKTALAAEVIWQLAPSDTPPEAFPDGIVFYSFDDQPQVDLALEHIVRSFNEEPKPTVTTATQRILASRRALIILDGAENADNLWAILNVLGSCGALVMSRNRQDAMDLRLDLARLSMTEAIALLTTWAGIKTIDPSVQRICELLGGLPLAVRLVGGYLAETKESPSEYLTWLEETPLQALDLGIRRLESIPSLLERSLTLVSEESRQIITVVGLLALSPFHSEVIAAALDTSISQLRHPLAELVSYALLTRVLGSTYEASHTLVHTYARERLTVPAYVIKRLTTYYINLTTEQTQQGLAGYQRLDTERAHLIHFLNGCREQENWEAAQRLVWVLDDYLDIQGYTTERISALKTGVLAAQKLGNRQDESALLSNLGSAYYSLGEVQRAIEYFEQGVVIAREIGDRQGEGTHLGNLGLAYSALGEVKQAIDYYEQALVIAREIGDRHGEGTHLGNLGLAYRDLGEVKRAIEYNERALIIAREIGDRRGEGYRLGNLGLAYRDRGEVKRAIDYYEQALVIAREIGDRHGEGTHLGNLGLAYHDLGEVQRAINYHEQALAISQQIDDTWNIGTQWSNLGLAYYELGNWQQAAEYSKHALAIYEKVFGSDHPRTRTIQQNLSKIEQEL